MGIDLSEKNHVKLRISSGLEDPPEAKTARGVDCGWQLNDRLMVSLRGPEKYPSGI